MKKFLCITLVLLLIGSVLPVSALSPDPVWNGRMATSFDGGSGTADDPYRIANGAQLAYLSALVSGGDRCVGLFFELTADVYLNDVSHVSSWATTAPANVFPAIGGEKNIPFGGHVNGNGHAIYGLYQSGSALGKGLFFNLAGTVRELALKKMYVASSASDFATGGIAAFTSAGAVIEECMVEGTFYAGGTLGGLAGIVSGGAVIRNCYANVSLMSGRTAGGLAGENNGSLSKSYMNGLVYTIDGSVRAGAPLAAVGSGSISECYYIDSWEKKEVWTPPFMSDGPQLREEASYNSAASLSAGGLALTAEQMKTAESFVGFDFEAVWTMEGETSYRYPQLICHQPLKGDANLDDELNVLDLLQIKVYEKEQTALTGRVSSALNYGVGKGLADALNAVMAVILGENYGEVWTPPFMSER